MKKLTFALLSLLLSVIIISPLSVIAFADDDPSYRKGEVYDQTGKISVTSLATINSYIDEAFEKYNCSVSIVYLDYVSSDDDTRDKNAEDYYYRHNYSENGVLLYLGVSSRSFDIFVSHGENLGIITYNEGELLKELILPFLRADDFDRAALEFARQALEFSSNDTTESFTNVKSASTIVLQIVVSFAIAFVISLIVVFIMKSGMNTVKKQVGASEYIKKGSVTIEEARDGFLFSTVTKVPKPEASSSSSSGGSHGGGSHHGGHF